LVSPAAAADFAVVLLPATDAGQGATDATAPSAAGATTETSVGVVDETTGELGSSAAFVGEVTVTADAASSTEAALLTERRNAAQISDSIGTEEMKKGTGSDAADVIKRVTGISLQNDKYVYVRGLGERYSNTALNGAKIPSTEYEKKVVPLDLFPAGLLEKIRVSKSYAVDKPGDFAAGFVEMETLDFPAVQQASMGLSLGHHSIATGEQFGRYGSGLAWSGSGGQALPGGIPPEKLVRLSPITGIGFTPAELQEFGMLFLGDWRGTAGAVGTPWGGGSYDAPLDSGYNLSYGNTFGRLGVVLSGTYANDYRAVETERNFYRYSELNPSGVELDNSFDFDTNVQTVRKGMVANFAYRMADNHHIRFRSLLNTLSFAETMFQEGFFSDLSADIHNYRANYKDQEVSTFQLSGEHYFETSSLGSLLEWRGSTSTAETAQDYRYSLYADFSGNGQYVLTDNSSSGFMFFNDLEDTVDDLAADWTTFLSGGSSFGSVKGGVAWTSTDRGFFGRRFRYKNRGIQGVDLTQAPEDIFVEQNISPNGFEIEETTRPTDNYTANQEIPAAYAQLDWTLGKWRLVGGVRYEASDIEVVSRDLFNPEDEPLITTLEDQDWLPSLSVLYRLTTDQNLRLTASGTVNRPEFRELSPFAFTDAVGSFDREGNPELVSASIRSYDARWEWFPSSADVIAVSLFYKDFSDPIEEVLVEGVTRIQTWENASTASNQGFELELRRGLGAFADLLDDFTMVVNYSYIDSEVTIPPGGVQTNDSRPLVGQPDHVGNLVLEWVQPEWGSGLRLLYNYTGEKVAFVGANGLPDVLEEPRGSVDLAFTQRFDLAGIGWTVKASAENLTEEPWEFTQAGERWTYFEPGVKLGVSLGLTFF
jgi:TonB-dependent receptor